MKNKMLASFAILMVALAGVGYAFGHWFEVLYVTGTVNTGEVDVYWSAATSNDAGTSLDPGLTPPLNDGGGYSTTGTLDTYGKHMATTTVATTSVANEPLDTHLATIAFTNVYPSYAPMVNLTVTSDGTIPVHLDGLQYAFSTTPITAGYPSTWSFTDSGYTGLQGVGVYLIGWDVDKTPFGGSLTHLRSETKGVYTIGTYPAGLHAVAATNVVALETSLYNYLSNGANVQLHTGDSVTIKLIYHFEQSMTELSTYYFAIRTRWTQWNLAGSWTWPGALTNP